MLPPITKEDARLCASVVKEVARAKGISRDPAAIGSLTATVARLFNRGMRDRVDLLSETMRISDIPGASAERSARLGEFQTTDPGATGSSLEPDNERGY